MKAIESGVIAKTTGARLAELESKQEIVEEKLAMLRATQVVALEVKTVKAFINYFATREDEMQEARAEFFNSFINKVILYNDKMVVLYNTGNDESYNLKIDEIIGVEREHKKSVSSELECSKTDAYGRGADLHFERYYIYKASLLVEFAV